jgi:hypothetical protein
MIIHAKPPQKRGTPPRAPLSLQIDANTISIGNADLQENPRRGFSSETSHRDVSFTSPARSYKQEFRDLRVTRKGAAPSPRSL